MSEELGTEGLVGEMSSPSRRKRKGTKSMLEPFLSLIFRRSRKKPKRGPKLESEKVGNGGYSRQGGKKAQVVPLPVSEESTVISPGRGLKRKQGCIDSRSKIITDRELEQDFVLGRTIGEGKFGSVRLCTHKNGGSEEFACKSLRRNGAGIVQKEIEIMQHLSGHPGIVTLVAVYGDDDSFHLVMELCSGGRLLDKMLEVGGRYSERKAAVLLKEFVSVIKYCHDMGVVHRDIKPENILLTASGCIKLADFGLATRVTDGQQLSGIAGSPAYVSPEVLTGSYGKKVDIWGAGVLLHALLVGALPFPGKDRDTIFKAIKTTELDFNSGVWQMISQLARDLISKMLCRDVTSRLTADQVLEHPWIKFCTENSLDSTSIYIIKHKLMNCSAVAPYTHGVVTPTVTPPYTHGGVDTRMNAVTSYSHGVETRVSAVTPYTHGVDTVMYWETSTSGSSSENSSCQKSDDEGMDDLEIHDGIVDLLTAGIGRVRISESERSKIYASSQHHPIQRVVI